MFVARRSENIYIVRASLRLIKPLGFFFTFTNEKGNMTSLEEHKLNS